MFRLALLRQLLELFMPAKTYLNRGRVVVVVCLAERFDLKHNSKGHKRVRKQQFAQSHAEACWEPAALQSQGRSHLTKCQLVTILK